jgi:transcriptional regulator with XRE-family HTH domain
LLEVALGSCILSLNELSKYGIPVIRHIEGSETGMRTFGKFIRQRRKTLGLTQRRLAALVRFEDGHSISEPYLNEIERDLRKPPRAHMIQQFAKAVEVSADVLFFLVGRLPDDLQDLDVSHEEVIAAFRTFREALEKTDDGHHHNGRAATLLKELP